jgi:transcriptional regulator with XRE-family HTH domain
MSHLGVTLKQLMQEFDFTGYEVAQKAGLQNSKVSRIIHGDRPRSHKDIVRLCEVFAKHPKTGAKTPMAQARLIAALCNDSRVGPGAELVKVVIQKPGQTGKYVRMSNQAEEAFEYIRSAIHDQPEREKFIIQLAEMMGAKFK